MSVDVAGEGPLHLQFITSYGTFFVRLYEELAPGTVAHVVGLVTGHSTWTHPKTGAVMHGRPFYDGLVVHRAAPNFMFQAGDPFSHPSDGDSERIGTGGPGVTIADEIAPSMVFDRPGLVAMANAGRPDTNGSQFFVTEVALPHLDGRHTIFGEVVEGFELVPKIARAGLVPPSGGRPPGPVVIESITVRRGVFSHRSSVLSASEQSE
jgi:peptidyl-prolyl cis-trans isomerase A (cyclophilin A)